MSHIRGRHTVSGFCAVSLTIMLHADPHTAYVRSDITSRSHASLLILQDQQIHGQISGDYMLSVAKNNAASCLQMPVDIANITWYT
jgi:hypothetical protein